MRGFDPHHPQFYDRDDLDAEMDRIFDVCHGCRLCWNLCPSFPALFDFIDDEEVEPKEVPRAVRDRVVDLCYNCKLCFPKCPYTPPHDYELDFPALMLRAKAVKAKHEGVSAQDKFLGHPELVGRIGRISPGMVNRLNAPGMPSRKVLQGVLGIEAERRLPPIAKEPFDRWFDRRGHSRPRGEVQGKVALFHTCSLNYHWPEAARALVEVLEHNGIEVVKPRQRCCGMPALDGGDVETATEWARDNIDSLHEAVAAGYEVVIPGPTCSLTIRSEYPQLVHDARAKEVAAHTFDAGEYLLKLHQEGRLDTDFAWRPAKIAYHLPCHLKVQNLGAPAVRLLGLTGAEVELVEKCSGMDGTWGMKKDYYALSMKQAKKLARGLEDVGAELFVSDCSLASLQVEEATDGGPRPLHPVEVLHRAYGLAGDDA